MLTARENMERTVFGGEPDRYVNQYEAIKLLFSPFNLHSPMAQKGEPPIVNAWGVTNVFPENTPGGFPVHTPDKILVKDIERWDEYVHAPSLKFSDEEWGMFKAQYDSIDRSKAYVATFIAPGLFEQTHHFCSIDQALMYYITNPDEMHDMIKLLTDWELEFAEGICSNLHPDAIFHHDDWGSQNSTFMSVPMFEEFFLDAYKEIYGYYKSHGVELIVHHSDSYAATLVPDMIEMGIDIWQGVMTTNDIPALIKKYGGQITFMGGIDSAKVDFPGWTKEDIIREVHKACDECGKLYFIPNASQGLAMSTFPGVYEALSEEIDAYSKIKF